VQHGIGLYLIDKKTNNVCLLFKFIVNIQTAPNVMAYRHSPRNSHSPLLTDSSSHTCGRRHPHWSIRGEWPTTTASPTLQ